MTNQKSTKVFFFKLSHSVDAPTNYTTQWIYWIVRADDPSKELHDLLVDYRVIKLMYQSDCVIEFDFEKNQPMYHKSRAGSNGKVVDPLFFEIITKAATIKFEDAIKELNYVRT